MKTQVLALAAVLMLSVNLASSAALASTEIDCIARTIYLEARGESRKGQAAIAHVIINRKRSGEFPTTACGVVRQKGQFARGSVSVTESPDYRQAREIARDAVRGVSGDPTGGAKYFMTHATNPPWIRKKRHTTNIGGHKFFR